MADVAARHEMTGYVCVITLDSPENRNALSSRLIADVDAALTVAERSARVVILTHTGNVFCSGADLRERLAGGAPRIDLIGRLSDLHLPTIAVVRGAARAGGVGLVAACDFVIATPSATFAFAEVRIGVVPAIISLPVLRKVAAGVAERLFLTGQTFDATAALEIGLVSTVAENEELGEAANELVGSLLKGSSTAQRAIKQMMRQLPRIPWSDRPTYVADLSRRMFESEEAIAGMRAFAERRPTPWAVDNQPLLDLTS